MTETSNNASSPEEGGGVCAGCLNQLLEEDYVSALGQEWHMECFRCSACDGALSSWYFEKDGLLFCQADYWTRYGEACQHCTQIITGPVMAAGDHRFHPECFCCELCNAFIGDGEAYALIERSKLYCGGCYERVMRPLGRGGGRRHAIQLVELPPRAPLNAPPLLRLAPDPHRGLTIKQLLYAMQGKLAALARSLLRATLSLCIQITQYSVDVSCSLMALHIGDRILEINGTPVKDQPIPHIEHLICYSDTVLQLTIEHDPDSLAIKPPQQSLRTAAKIQNVCDVTTLAIGDSATKPTAKEMQNITNSQTKEPNPAEEIAVNSAPDLEPCIEDCIADEKKTCEQENNILDDSLGEQAMKMDDDLEFLCRDSLSKSNMRNGHLPQIPGAGSRERVFKRRGEDGGGGARARHRWRRAAPPSRHITPLTEKERSSSMSRLLDGSAGEHMESEEGGVLCDLSRTRSFRVDARPPPTVFRAADLIQGELLGSGFFGQVFKVTHRDTNEVMVLKQLYRVDEDAQKNFLKEVAVLRSLSHPNVLRFIGVLYKERRLHLVTEYVSGGTLRSLLEGPRAPPWAERAGYARDIAAGLAYLHTMNVIHRDLNSHNCLVREDKTVIVADFGLARIVKRTGVSGSLERSQRGSARERKKRYTVVGNPYWMAPEMMKGYVYDEKVDVFSFGIVLCEIIGRVHADPDFLPRSSDFGLNQSLFRDTFCHGCPEHLYSIAFLCCNLNPDKRPPFEVMEVWLEALTMHLSVQCPPPQDLLTDILQYSGSPDSPPPEEATPPPVLKKSKSGDVLKMENKLKASSLPQTVRGLGPKCISASHLCLPSKPVAQSNVLSKSQNALSTPAGYILSTDDKTINITKVDDVREWLDRPIVLRNGGISKESLAEKRQSVDSSINESDFTFQSKARKVAHQDPLTRSESYKKVIPLGASNDHFDFTKPKIDALKVLKSKSHHCNTDFEKEEHTDVPNYLRNQSVEELETEAKMIVDSIQPFSRHYSIPNHLTVDNNDNSSDSDDTCEEVKIKTESPSAFRRMFRSDKKSYTVNTNSPSSKSGAGEPENGKKKVQVASNIKLLQQNFEPKAEEPQVVPEKHHMSFNTFAKKLMSPKLGRKSMSSINKPLSKIFSNSSSNNQAANLPKECKSDKNPKGKSTFFVTTPQHVETNIDKIGNNAQEVPRSPKCRNKIDETPLESPLLKDTSENRRSKMQIWQPDLNKSSEGVPAKPPNIGKSMTPLLRRHNRQVDDTSSVGRFSYREKRSSPLKYTLPDKNIDLARPDRYRGIVEKNTPIRNNVANLQGTAESGSDVPAPLVRCNNFRNIPSMNKVVDQKYNKDCKSEIKEVVPSHKINTIPAQQTFALVQCFPDAVTTIAQNAQYSDTAENKLVASGSNNLVLVGKESQSLEELNAGKNESHKKNFENTVKCFEKGISTGDLNSTGNYVSLANLRINCPSLSRTRESLVKRNISKFDPNGSTLRSKPNRRSPDKCALNDETSTSPENSKNSLESTIL